VNPSGTAPALVALDASMVIKGAKGERIVAAEEYWIDPVVEWNVIRRCVEAVAD